MSNLNLIPIGKLFDLEKGSLQSSKCTEGEYTFITAAEEWKTHNEYSHECEALIFAAAASGSLGRTHYINDKFITSDLCFILTPKDSKKYPINLKFYHFVFNSLKDEIVKNTKSGTSKESINQSNLRNYKIPYFEIDKQNLWIDKLVNTKSIKEDLEFELSSGQSLLKQLKQTILQEAIEGKLTEKWRAKNPDIGTAKELLAQIKIEKEKLIKEKKLKASKPLAPINEDEIPFDIPSSWEWCRFGNIVEHNAGKTLDRGRNKGLAQKYITTSNLYWGYFILDDLKEMLIDESELSKCTVQKGDLLVCEGGEAGRSAVWENDETICIQNHIHRVRPYQNINTYYLYYYLMKIFLTGEIDNYRNGMGIKNLSGKSLSTIIIPIAPKEEQKEIVATIEKLFAICDELECEINQNKTTVDNLMATVLKEAFEQQ